MQPETRYARSDDVNIAYQVVGHGPLDLVLVPGWVSNVEFAWEEPRMARFLSRLAAFSRLIFFDKRGTGLSDRDAELPTLEQRMDDVRAVMDAAGSERAAIVGYSEGGPMCALFAATYPERTAALIMYGAYAKRLRSPDYPWGPTAEERDKWFARIGRDWGGAVRLENLAPSLANDQRFQQWWATYLRHSASPGAALTISRVNTEIDVRDVLPTIRVPTLVLNRTGDRVCPVEGSRYMAQRIAGASYVELPGDDHLPFAGDIDALVGAIQEFLTGAPPVVEEHRVLTTVLFVDVAGSTAMAADLGDRRWADLLDAYRAAVRRELQRFRGVERSTAGDGLLASFDGPGRAIRCAEAITEAAHHLGVEIRCGLHTGECEVRASDLSGIAVHIGARVAALAAPGEILVTGTVKDLVAGSGLEFVDVGRRTLKGVPGVWRLYAVEQAAGADRP